MTSVIDAVEINTTFEQHRQSRWVAARVLTHAMRHDQNRPRRPRESPTVSRDRDTIRPRQRKATFRDPGGW